MDPIPHFRQAGEFFLTRFAVVPAAAWDRMTPCPEWTVRGVAAHVINGFQLVPALLAQKPPDPRLRNEDTLGAEPVRTGRAALAAAVEALRRPGALDVMVTTPAGRMPARGFTQIRMADTVIHTWDMAAGAGIDTTIPPDLIEAVMAASPPAFIEGAREAGVFGPAAPADALAGPQERLLALYGRSGTGPFRRGDAGEGTR